MRKLIRAKVRFKGLSVGLDVHKKFIQFSVMDRKGNEIELGRVRSTEDELKNLVERLKAKDAVQCSLEACGCFIWIFDQLVEQIGREFVHVAHPSKLAAAKSREKNDANDAWWLAYQLYEGTLPEAMVAEGALRELRIATREVRWWTEDLSKAEFEKCHVLFQKDDRDTYIEKLLSKAVNANQVMATIPRIES